MGKTANDHRPLTIDDGKTTKDHRPLTMDDGQLGKENGKCKIRKCKI